MFPIRPFAFIAMVGHRQVYDPAAGGGGGGSVLPTAANLQTLDYAWRGQPFCIIGAKSAVDLQTLNYAWRAQPVTGPSA